MEITAAFPAGIIGTTLENLEASAAGEKYEYTEMYPEFSAIAREEGFDEIAHTFTSIAVAEMQHEKQYRAFIDNINSNNVFQREQPAIWYCANCGYIHEGNEAPSKCPACAHPQAYFQLIAENW